ncbi:MAG: hypothetical protein LBQ10_00620, partial [Desulfovibrio sp.]|nr:hypothetical protein [Desulfovibrio sp.]
KLPRQGRVFLSVNDRDKGQLPEVARALAELGFELVATRGTADLLRESGLAVRTALKVHEGRPNVVDMIKNGELDMLINTASGKLTAGDSRAIREATLQYGLPYTTTMSGARAIARAINAMRTTEPRVRSIQSYYQASPAWEAREGCHHESPARP